MHFMISYAEQFSEYSALSQRVKKFYQNICPKLLFLPAFLSAGGVISY